MPQSFSLKVKVAVYLLFPYMEIEISRGFSTVLLGQLLTPCITIACNKIDQNIYEQNQSYPVLKTAILWPGA